MNKRPISALLLSLLCLLPLGGQAAASSVGATAAATASVQSDVVFLINGYRAANGLGPVSPNGSLAAAASWMASDMATKNYFSHTSSDGRSPQQRMAAFGYPAYALYTGENIAAGQASAADVVAGWKASPAHNAVLLSANFNAIGVGYAYNAAAAYKSYWVADLGGPGGNVAALAPPAPIVTVAAPAPAPSSPDAAAPASPEIPVIPDAAIEARAATTARGEPRSGDPSVTSLPSDGFSMRRFLHLLAVLDRMDRVTLPH